MCQFSKTLSLEQAQVEINSRCTNIWRHYELLQEIMSRHESTIRKRWIKKTKDKKQNILTTAWGPDMPKMHRPDFHALRHDSDAGCWTRDAHRNRSAYMWPYINIEDLTKPTSFLLLLNARGRSPPPEFAAADANAMKLGSANGAIKSAALEGYVLCLTGQDKQNYGKLVSREGRRCASCRPNYEQFSPDEGLLVLECQERLLCFLISCVRSILHELSGETLLSAAMQPEPSPLVAEDGSAASLTMVIEETQYRRPLEVDFDRLTKFLEARHEHAKDHLWLLRENPQYFADTVRGNFEHRPEQIKDALGRKHSLFQTNQPEILWGRVIPNEILWSSQVVDTFSELAQQAAAVRDLNVKYHPAPDEDLVEELWIALAKFQDQLKHTGNSLSKALRFIFPASPSWRDRFVRNPESHAEDSQSILQHNHQAQMSDDEQYLLWLLWALCSDDGRRNSLGLPLLVDEIQRTIDTSREVRISELVASRLSDVSIIAECLRQIESFQPWARQLPGKHAKYKDLIRGDWSQLDQTLARRSESIYNNERRLALEGMPTGERFFYPNDKRRTCDTVEAMRRAEANLDSFWALVDECWTVGDDDDASDSPSWKTLEVSRKLHRTAPWIAQEITPKRSGKKLPQEPCPTFASTYSDGEDKSSGRQLARSHSPRSKEKTRGVPRPCTEPEVPQEELTQSAVPIPVSARAHQVFKTLFFTPKAGSQPGELAWHDFLHAMTTVGFHAEKLYGSVWQFSPVTQDLPRSIQFHEPHPTGKVPFYKARQHGRRLQMAFGWTVESFVIEGSEPLV